MLNIPDIGDILDGWVIDTFIAAGRSGIVYKVRDAATGQRIAAIKILCGPTLEATETEFLAESDFVEAQPLPGYMPAFYGKGNWEGCPFFVMEFAEELPKRLPPKVLKRIIRSIARALGALHRKGYIHCDVKPKNIGVIDGRIVLLDFGSIRGIEFASHHPARVGTWEYMAPEVRDGKVLDIRADVFSLGVTLRELAKSGSGNTFVSLTDSATESSAKLRPQTMDEFADLVTKCSPLYQQFKIIATRTLASVAVVFTVSVVWYLNTMGEVVTVRDQRTRADPDYNVEKQYNAALADYRLGDYTNAVEILMTIANIRHPRAPQVCRRLAEFYHYGLGVEKDETKSREYTEKARRLEALLAESELKVE